MGSRLLAHESCASSCESLVLLWTGRILLINRLVHLVTGALSTLGKECDDAAGHLEPVVQKPPHDLRLAMASEDLIVGMDHPFMYPSTFASSPSPSSPQAAHSVGTTSRHLPVYQSFRCDGTRVVPNSIFETVEVPPCYDLLLRAAFMNPVVAASVQD